MLPSSNDGPDIILDLIIKWPQSLSLVISNWLDVLQESWKEHLSQVSTIRDTLNNPARKVVQDPQVDIPCSSKLTIFWGASTSNLTVAVIHCINLHRMQNIKDDMFNLNSLYLLAQTPCIDYVWPDPLGLTGSKPLVYPRWWAA